MVHEQMHFFMRGFRRDAHPMAVMIGLVGALSAFYHDSIDINDARQREISAIRLIAKLPTIVAMAYKYTMRPAVHVSAERPVVRGELHAHDVRDAVRGLQGQRRAGARARPHPHPARRPRAERVDLDGAPVRVARAPTRSPCIAAGVACLWGPAHGGANEAALNMLYDIEAQGGVAKIGEFITKVKDKNSSVKLMGFGHRVYKNYDPRAKLMRETCHEVLDELGLQDDPLFKLAMALEKIALEDDYFVQRKLYPNVDFYSGIVQKALGIPVPLFTAIFALARTVGWIAQWNEMICGPGPEDRPPAAALRRRDAARAVGSPSGASAA